MFNGNGNVEELLVEFLFCKHDDSTCKTGELADDEVVDELFDDAEDDAEDDDDDVDVDKLDVADENIGEFVF